MWCGRGFGWPKYLDESGWGVMPGELGDELARAPLGGYLGGYLGVTHLNCSFGVDQTFSPGRA